MAIRIQPLLRSLVVLSLAACGDDDAAPPDAAPPDAAAPDAAGPDACVPLAEPVAMPCDVSAQDCACGDRCILWGAAGTNTFAPACAPVLDDAAEDEGCTRPDGDFGEDTCAEGLYCSNLGRPVGTTDDRICHRYCLSSDECEEGQVCSPLAEEATPPAGYCLRVCDPFATPPCLEGEACILLDLTEAGEYALTCSNQKGTGTEGTPCAGDTECAPGLTCTGSTGDLHCVPFCDGTHPCTTGTCTPAPGGYFSVCR